MMRFNPELRRRMLLPLLAAGLLAAYLFLFLPLDRKANSMEGPLSNSWRRLAAALGQTNAMALDFINVTNQFNETRIALNAYQTAREQARSRVELPEDLRAQIAAPFQLVDYETEAVRVMSAMRRLARDEKITLDPAVLGGFPDQTAEMTEPSLLWAELAFIESVLTTAIHAKVTAIHSLSAPAPLTNAPSVTGPSPPAELPVNIELTGSMQNVGNFLQALPLRPAEIKAAGLPEAPTNKPALFIDRIVLKKQSPDKLDEVRLSLRAVGFVFRE